MEKYKGVKLMNWQCISKKLNICLWTLKANVCAKTSNDVIAEDGRWKVI